MHAQVFRMHAEVFRMHAQVSCMGYRAFRMHPRFPCMVQQGLFMDAANPCVQESNRDIRARTCPLRIFSPRMEERAGISDSWTIVPKPGSRAVVWSTLRQGAWRGKGPGCRQTMAWAEDGRRKIRP
ncbi:MAG TPA: hypothetical protein VK753_11900 [Xanthomonadaceae bacterium]|nr:hypothetical protein [Xanthomonadaceae bacterium]